MASLGMEDQDWMSKEDSLMYSLTKLSGAGHEVTVHALTEEQTLNILERQGYSIILHPVDVLDQDYGEQTSRSLFRNLKSENPDIVYLNSLNMSMNRVLVHAMEAPRFVLRAHGKLIHDFLVEEVNALEVSNRNQKFAATDSFTIPSDNIWINPFGADTSIFKPDWNASKQFDVVYAGRLVKGKNLELLLRSMMQIDGKLLLIGKGRDEIYYKELVKGMGLESKVTFQGWVENTRMPDYLNMAKVFVMPSLSEGGGRSMAEAMACGLPVIAMKGAIGSEAYVEHGRVGYVVRPSRLMSAINSLIRDESRLKEFGTRSRELAVDQYSSESFYKRMKNLIESLEDASPIKRHPDKKISFHITRLFRFNYWLAVRNRSKGKRIERMFRPQDN